MSKKDPQGVERRKFKRTSIQDSFSLFVVIPKSQGMARIYLRDLSKAGLCFKVDLPGDFSVGQEFELRLYTSPAFFLSLEGRVVRLSDGEVAVEYKDPESKAARAIAKLQEFIELALEV